MSTMTFEQVPDLISLRTEDNVKDPASERLCEKPVLKASKSVATRTQIKNRRFEWDVDVESLKLALMASRGGKDGVISTAAGGFELELCASGWRHSQEGYAAFYLTAPSAQHSTGFVARYRVSVGDVTRVSSIRRDFHLGVGFPNFCKHETFYDSLKNGFLRFSVCVEMFCFESAERSAAIAPTPGNVLGTWTRSLFQKREHSDVTLVCGGVRIGAHKCVLACASPLFRAMFCTKKAPTICEVPMDDYRSEAVQSMVYFVYNGHLPKSAQIRDVYDLIEAEVCGDDDNDDVVMGLDDDECRKHPAAGGLLQLAERYEMKPLVIACCEQMHRLLTVESVCDVLVRVEDYAQMAEVRPIAEALWQFAMQNMGEVKRSAGFSRMLSSDPRLAAQLIDRITQ